MGTTNKPSATGIMIFTTFMSTTNTHEGFYFNPWVPRILMNHVMTISDDKMSTDTLNR
jgi:hypothetical protein